MIYIFILIRKKQIVDSDDEDEDFEVTKKTSAPSAPKGTTALFLHVKLLCADESARECVNIQYTEREL
jgi:hypothetical protein